jgi:hypothetical protein
MTRVEELQAAKEGADKGLEGARHAKEQKQKEVRSSGLPGTTAPREPTRRAQRRLCACLHARPSLLAP